MVSFRRGQAGCCCWYDVVRRDMYGLFRICSGCAYQSAGSPDRRPFQGRSPHQDVPVTRECAARSALVPMIERNCRRG